MLDLRNKILEQQSVSGVGYSLLTSKNLAPNTLSSPLLTNTLLQTASASSSVNALASKYSASTVSSISLSSSTKLTCNRLLLESSQPLSSGFQSSLKSEKLHHHGNLTSSVLSSGSASLLSKYSLSSGSGLSSLSGKATINTALTFQSDRKRPLHGFSEQLGLSGAKKVKWEKKVALLDDFAAEGNYLCSDNEEPCSTFHYVSRYLLDYVPSQNLSTLKAADSAKGKLELEEMRIKIALVNAVLGALIGSPSLRNQHDKTRLTIIAMVKRVAAVDAEFVLKLAVFSRRAVGLRAVSNLLIALAAHDSRMRASLRKYFNAAVELPSDWLEVAEQYRTLVDPNGQKRKLTLPKALRSAMAQKFVEFDEYQLAKYNTERNRVKRRRYRAKLQQRSKADPKSASASSTSWSKSSQSASNKDRDSGSSDSDTSSESSSDTASTKSSAESTKQRSGSGSLVSEATSESRSTSSSGSSPGQVVTAFASKNKFAVLQSDAGESESESEHLAKVNRSNKSLGMSKKAKRLVKQQKQQAAKPAKQNSATTSKPAEPPKQRRPTTRGGRRDVATSRPSTTPSVPAETEHVGARPFTLKQLVRLLHIAEPADLVVGLLGKRYPSSMNDFVRMRLNGVFDASRAGQRMRLRTPMTWETQVSAAGNCAAIWEKLIDSNKLPFMATLRNLRNLLIAGISRAHHGRVMAKLMSPQSVRASRQFPFRFLSAFQVLEELQRTLSLATKNKQPKRVRRKLFKHGQKNLPNKNKDKEKERWNAKAWFNKPLKFDSDLIDRYKASLERALQISAMWNLDPIRGSTWILINCRAFVSETLSKKLYGKFDAQSELALMLGFLAKFCSEDCKLVLFNSDSSKHKELAFDPSESENILEELSRTVYETYTFFNNVNAIDEEKQSSQRLPRVLTDSLYSETTAPIDTLLFVTSNENGTVSREQQQLAAFVNRYRSMRNQNLLLVSLDLGAAGSSASIVDAGSVSASDSSSAAQSHPNDIVISGFSDQILRFVAARGNQRLLASIENLGRAVRLHTRKQTAANAEESDDDDILAGITEDGAAVETSAVVAADQSIERPLRRTVRVFVSSTFADMHAERDFLARFVMPQLRESSRLMHIDLVDVDLRWGIRIESQSQAILETCLSEARRADFLIAIVGDRAGWQPLPLSYPDWLADQLATCSDATRQQNDLIRSLVGDLDWPALLRRPDRALPADQRKQLPTITQLEIASFIFSRDLAQVRRGAAFFFRDPSFIDTVPAEHRSSFSSSDSAASAYRARLGVIKSAIAVNQLQMFEYSCEFGGLFEGRPIVTGLSRFAELVQSTLHAAIKEIKETAQVATKLQMVAREASPHEAYFDYLNAACVPRKAELSACVGAINDAMSLLRMVRRGASGGSLLLLSGDAGSGRSTFAANLIQLVSTKRSARAASQPAKQQKVARNSLVLSHFVDCVSSASDLPAALKRMTSELLQAVRKLRHGAQLAACIERRLRLEQAVDVNALINAFCKACDLASRLFTGVYVLIDDLDRCCSAPDCVSPAAVIQRFSEKLKPRFGYLLVVFTLPSSSAALRDAQALVLAQNERLAKSAQSATTKSPSVVTPASAAKSIRAMVSANSNSAVAPQLPNVVLAHFKLSAMSSAPRNELVKSYFTRFSKSLRESLLDNEVRLMMNKRDGGIPLYLVTACEELRLVAQYDTISTQIREIPQTLTSLLGRIFERLEGEFGVPIVKAAVLLISNSLDGLLESELRVLLTVALIVTRPDENSEFDNDNGNGARPAASSKSRLQLKQKLASGKQSTHGKWQVQAEDHYDFPLKVDYTLNRIVRNRRAMLSQAGVSRLCYELRQLLCPGSTDAGGRIAVVHTVALEAIENRYLKPASRNGSSALRAEQTSKDPDTARLCHTLLLSFYEDKLIALDLLAGSCSNFEGVDLFKRILFYCNKLRIWSLRYLLLNPGFVFRMLLAGERQMLLDAYALAKFDEDDEYDYHYEKGYLKAFWQFVLRVSGTLRQSQNQNPAYQFLQTALNEPVNSLSWFVARQVVDEMPLKDNVFIKCLNRTNFCNYDNATERFHDTVACTALALSPLPTSCQLIALGYDNGAVRVCEYVRGALRATLNGHEQRITHLLFVPRQAATLLVSSSADNSISVWNVDSALRLAALSHHDRAVTACVFDRVSAQLISVGLDARICFWSLEAYRMVSEITTERKPIACIAQKPQTDEFIVGSWDCHLRIYSATSRLVTSTLRGHRTALKDVVWTELRIISCSLDGQIRIWSQNQTGPFQTVGVIDGHHSLVNALAVSDCGNFLATANSDKTLCVYRTKVGSELRDMQLKLNDGDDERSSTRGDRPNSVVIATDYILVGTAYGQVHAFDVEIGRYSIETGVRNGSNTLLAKPPVASEQDRVVVCQQSTVVLLSRSKHADKLAVTSSFGAFPKQSSVPITAVTCGSKVLVVANANGCVAALDLADLEVPALSKTAATRKDRFEDITRDHEGVVSGCSLNRSESHLATVGRDCAIVLYKVSLNPQACTLQQLCKTTHAHPDWITSVAWSDQNDAQLVTASQDCTVTLWSVDYALQSEVGKEECKLTSKQVLPATSPITCVKLHCDLVVASSRDGVVRVWNVEGQLVTDFCCAQQQQDAAIEGVVMDCLVTYAADSSDRLDAENSSSEEHGSDDRRPLKFLIAAVGGDRIVVYQPMKTRNLATLVGHSDRVIAVKMNNQSVISSSLDCTVREWSVPACQSNSKSSSQGSSSSSSSDDEIVGPVTCLQPWYSENHQKCVVIAGTKLGYLLATSIEATGDEFSESKSLKLLLSPSHFAVNALCAASQPATTQSESNHCNVYFALNDSKFCEYALTCDSKGTLNATFKRSHDFGCRITGLRLEKSAYLWACTSSGTVLVIDVKSFNVVLKTAVSAESTWLAGLCKFPSSNEDLCFTWSPDKIFIAQQDAKRPGSYSSPRKSYQQIFSVIQLLTEDDVKCGEVARSITDVLALQSGTETLVFTGFSDGRLLQSVFNKTLNNGQEASTLSWTKTPSQLHRDAITCLCVANVCGNNLLITAGNDCTVRLWKLPELKQCGEFIGTSQLRSVSVLTLPGQRYLLVVGDDRGCVGIFDLLTSKSNV